MSLEADPLEATANPQKPMRKIRVRNRWARYYNTTTAPTSGEARLRPGYGPVTARLRPGYGQCRVGRRHWEWLLRVYSAQQIGFGRHNIFNVAGEFLKLVSEGADEPAG